MTPLGTQEHKKDWSDDGSRPGASIHGAPNARARRSIRLGRTHHTKIDWLVIIAVGVKTNKRRILFRMQTHLGR